MLTGMLAARNVAPDERHDVWSVNVDRAVLEKFPRLAATPATAAA